MLAIRLLAVFVMVWIATPLTAGDKMPNILIVMVDDMGYSDLGCYGGEIRTPHLDALADQGLRFSAFYNTGRCCPTRASLLTGLYPHQTGVGKMTFEENLPGYRGFLQPHCVTIAEVLRDNGYETGMIGKWHLSQMAVVNLTTAGITTWAGPCAKMSSCPALACPPPSQQALSSSIKSG